MSKLEELIQQYCPDGVEWKALGEATIMKRGTSATKGIMQEGDVPVISGGRQPAFYCNVSNRTGEVITVAGSGAGAGYVQYWNEPIFVCDAFSIQGNETLKTKYVYYILTNIQEKIYSTKKGGGVPHVHISSIDKFEIPVPPLPVQEEIVRILDNFTELQAELQAELQKRKLQYNYYLDNLLSFNRGQTEVRWMKLKDVATQWYRGAGIKREEVSEDGMPCIRYGEIHTTYNIWFDDCISHADESKQVSRKYAEKGDILFAITSEDVPFVGNSVAYLGNERILVGGDIVVMKHNQDPKYMAYALSTSDAIKQKGKGKVKSKVVHTNVPSLQEIVIPIPSMTEQKRIASILDRFDTLTTDLTQGLPAEIEKRRQQYEYYRDKLLTFKRKEA